MNLWFIWWGVTARRDGRLQLTAFGALKIARCYTRYFAS
jgi:hypothetical protein